MTHQASLIQLQAPYPLSSRRGLKKTVFSNTVLAIKIVLVIITATIFHQKTVSAVFCWLLVFHKASQTKEVLDLGRSAFFSLSDFSTFPFLNEKVDRTMQELIIVPQDNHFVLFLDSSTVDSDGECL